MGLLVSRDFFATVSFFFFVNFVGFHLSLEQKQSVQRLVSTNSPQFQGLPKPKKKTHF